MNRILIIAVAWLSLCGQRSIAGEDKPTLIGSAEYGAVGDGLHDDGPAITAMLKKAAETRGSTVLRFEPHRSYLVKTAGTRYIFPLDGATGVTVDGGGSVFLVDGNLRFLKLRASREIVVKDCRIDYVPLPFADGEVIAKNAQEGFIDVQVSPGFALPPLGGPTHQDGEQTYFGMFWYPENERLLSLHYEIADLREAYPGSLEKRVVRVFAATGFRGFNAITPGRWRISLPVRGVAHRYGPGPTIDIVASGDVTLQNVEIRSAPWMAIQALGNHGKLNFLQTHIRPGEGRLTSSWRDGFHVKGNSGPLRWEDCEVTGTNDDAFNISTHASRVLDVLSPSRVVTRQAYAGGYIPWRVGDTFVAADFPTGRLLGKSQIRTVEESTTAAVGATPPKVTVTLATPLGKIAAGSLVWAAETSNPDVTLRRCKINNSCRFQSGVRLEKCDARGLIWFYADPLEGPLPAGAVLKDCDLRRGRGNPTLALLVDGHADGASARGPAREDTAALPFALNELQIEDCRIDGDVAVTHVEDVRMWNNIFRPEDRLSVRDVARQSLKSNRISPDHVSASQTMADQQTSP